MYYLSYCNEIFNYPMSSFTVFGGYAKMHASPSSASSSTTSSTSRMQASVRAEELMDPEILEQLACRAGGSAEASWRGSQAAARTCARRCHAVN